MLFVNLCAAAAVLGQTTQGVISGRLVSSTTGRPVSGASVEYFTGSTRGSVMSDASGYYFLLLLSPGIYRVRVTAPTFQSQEVQERELPVAARIELDLRLRPLSDVWESGQYRSVFLPGSKTVVTFFGPDVDPSLSGSFEAQTGRLGALESTVSEVIDSAAITNLPLAGRDVYTMLVTLPGVTSDAATARGLGLSVNGQRPSSSNYLLDGLENNNYLTTGPLTTVAPEAIQEYRVSTNNFSAEYGRTSGFVANAITRQGSGNFHGVAYFYQKNDALNANGFQENRQGIRRAPDKEIQPGFVVGGPIRRNRVFFSSSYEYFRSRSAQDPQTFQFPNTPVILGFAPPGSEAVQILRKYAPPAVAGSLFSGTLTLAPPVEVDRTLAVERFDYTPAGGKDRVMARLMGSFLAQPDFVWSPYKDFISALHENTWSIGITGTHSFRANLTNEIRAGYSGDDLHWDRAHSEIPTLISSDGTTLPGSPAFYAYKNVNRTWEFLDNAIWARDKHLIKAGAGLLVRSSDGYLTADQAGEYVFNNVADFAFDDPSFFTAAVDRTALPNIQQPNTNRSYRYRQYFGFVQDAYRLSSRFTVNYGLRYELFGAPQNTGSAKDVLLTLGAGSTLAQQLATATLAMPASGNQTLFGTDKNDWSVRAGAAYDLSRDRRTVLRGAFGTFYDRPFDNLWENLRNNNSLFPILDVPQSQTNFLGPVTSELSLLSKEGLGSGLPNLTLIDPRLHNGLVKSYFAGIERRFSDILSVELNGLGSYGSHLITTDIVNRDFSTLQGRYNPSLPDVSYRSGQGTSNYNAMTAVLRYRTGRGMVEVNYTWSHVIDNQSEPLLGDFFNLNFVGIQASPRPGGQAAFAEQFNPSADRGSADFDQRHNLVLLGYWNVRNWTISALSAFRSGFPYSVVAPSSAILGQGIVLNNRPDIVDPAKTTFPQRTPVPGGEQLLNPAAFAETPPSALGNAGRNAFRGPGFYNLDLSLARSFRMRWLGDAGRLTFRASAFNALNHANLNNPDPLLTSPTFGQALFGRQGTASGFPAVSPLNETPRQFQLSARFEF